MYLLQSAEVASLSINYYLHSMMYVLDSTFLNFDKSLSFDELNRMMECSQNYNQRKLRLQEKALHSHHGNLSN